MTRLEGKVALVTGAARGQGAAEARLFASEGARVVLTDVLDEEGELTAKSIGESALYLHQDVTEEDGWATVVATVKDRFGRIDVLVNNAGVFSVSPLTATPLAEYERVIRINQIGVFLGMRAVAPTMIEQRSGAIVNISSVAGLQGSANTISYSASKWAVRGMTKVAARELAPFGLRVNSVHPGIIDTEMLAGLIAIDEVRKALTDRIPMGRIAAADEVAKLVLYLASDESGYSTGSEFVVDGGMTAGV